ncbi:MAG: hypothetical protein EAX86_12190 [Candidatus Heimdallarchaeota archaeon]|nr:hypothetical protein [Candidatus Heimdallarchaeota archaeon]
MKKNTNDRLAILIHGFAGKTGFMNEIEAVLKDPPFNESYLEIRNLSFYASKHGLDVSHTFDIRTPIYSQTTDLSLAHHLSKQILHIFSSFESPPQLDIFAHSMGGLVARSMVHFLRLDEKIPIKNIFLMGTPNYGTRMAQKIFTIPADFVITGLNILLELPQGNITPNEWNLMKSQFIQMDPDSSFLKQLNSLKPIETIKWFTVRGLKSTGQLGIIWQPILFNKFWFDDKFPFIHIGQIPNDGLVEASSVPLPYAMNFTVPEATHMDLLKWRSRSAGRCVKELLQPWILNEKIK